MSAFVMRCDEIGKIACFASHVQRMERLIDTTPKGRRIEVKVEDFAMMLAVANLESVAYRYQLTMDEAAREASELGWLDFAVETRRFALQMAQDFEDARRIDYVEMARLVDCYDYQSCETPDFAATRVGRWVAAMVAYLKGRGQA